MGDVTVIPTTADVDGVTLEKTAGIINIKAGGVGDLQVSSISEAKLLLNRNTTVLSLAQAKQAIKILLLEADGTVSSQDYDDVFADVFEDANGYNNTINTGGSTAVFKTATKEYRNEALGAGDDDASGTIDGETDIPDADWWGEKITVGAADIRINTVTKYHTTGANATECKIVTATGTLVESVSFSTDTATFSTNILTAATSYFVLIKGTPTWYLGIKAASYPYNRTNLNFVANGRQTNGAGTPGEGTTNCQGVISINSSTTGYASKLIQTAALTTTASNISHIMVVAEGDTANIDVDVSADNGAHYQTAQALNTKIAIADVGTQPMVKINVKGTAQKNCQGYAVVLWTV